MIYVGEFISRVIGQAWSGSGRREWIGGLATLVLMIVIVGAGFSPIIANINPADAVGLNHRYRQVAAFVQQNTPPSAVILTQAQSGPLIELQNALAWYSRRQFVQYGSYTADALKSHNSSQPTFVLIAAGDPKVKKNLPDPGPESGLTPIAHEKDETGKVIAILCRQE